MSTSFLSSRSGRLGVLFLAGLLFLFAAFGNERTLPRVFGSDDTGAVSSRPDSQKAEAQKTEAQKPEASKSTQTKHAHAEHHREKHEFVKLIPSPQRALLTRMLPPPTRIDLDGVYESYPGFEDCIPVSEIKIRGDEKVARCTIEEGDLVLEWKGIGKSQILIQTVNPKTGFTVDETVKLEVVAPDYLKMFCTLLGGLGVFLLGMKYMSEGVQMVAGKRLRRLIGTFTNNRCLAVGVGVLTTVAIQSSSATTVMVVGFVNSQIMTLSQGIGVIMGANIGTTFTAWIMAMKIDPLIMPLIGVSAGFFLFSKRDTVRFAAMAGLGLGFIFFGMRLMQDGFADLAELPDFVEWMNFFSADTYGGVLLCALVGCILTMILQASAATIGITIALATIGLIDFRTAVALVLGENVGTTITALLASIGLTTNARRAAYFHSVFNTIGVLWVSALFLPLDIPGKVALIVGTNPVTGEITNIKFGIALAHSLFNITNMLLFLPFVHIAANLLIRFVPENKEHDSQKRLTGLNFRLLETASISIERSRIEIQRMGNCCTDLATSVYTIIEAPQLERKDADHAFEQEEVLDTLQDEIIAFTSGLLSGNISHDIAASARNQLKMADEIESIGDYLVIILKSNLKLHEAGHALPSPEREEILALHQQMNDYLKAIFRHYAQRRPGPEVLPLEHSQGKTLNATAKSIRDRFLKRISEEKFDPQLIVAINTQLNAYRRIREHGRNVAEAISGVR